MSLILGIHAGGTATEVCSADRKRSLTGNNDHPAKVWDAERDRAKERRDRADRWVSSQKKLLPLRAEELESIQTEMQTLFDSKSKK